MKIIVGFVVVSLIALYLGMTFGNNAIEPVVDDSSAVVVSLSVKGSSYILEPSVFDVGVPVKLVGSSLPGCSRSVVIPDFNVRKVLSESDNSVTFVPSKTGKFKISCSMNMYQGSFSVV